MQNEIDVYNKTQYEPKIAVMMNPDFPTTRKTPKKSKKAGKKSVSNMVIAKPKKRFEEYDPINKSAQAKADINFGHIARGDLDFAKNDL